MCRSVLNLKFPFRSNVKTFFPLKSCRYQSCQVSHSTVGSIWVLILLALKILIPLLATPPTSPPFLWISRATSLCCSILNFFFSSKDCFYNNFNSQKSYKEDTEIGDCSHSSTACPTINSDRFVNSTSPPLLG